MGLILLRRSLTLPRTPPQTPVLYSAVTNPLPVAFLGYVHTQNTSNPTSDPKTPHPWPELKSGQNELQSGQNGPKLGKMVEKCAKLFWSGQKKIHSYHQCSQHLPHPSPTVSQGLLLLPSSTLQLQQSQPHPFVRCQTVCRYFVTAKLSMQQQNPRAPIQWNDAS